MNSEKKLFVYGCLEEPDDVISFNVNVVEESFWVLIFIRENFS